MKKIITFIFFLMTIVSFSEDKNITLIKNLKLLVNEKTFVNNKATAKSYEVTYSLPDTLKKVMTEPKSHKGEIFIYKDNTKTVYLPIFDQVIKEDNIDEENFLVETIKYFQENYKKSENFRKIYNLEKSFTVKKDNLVFDILKMGEFDGYRLPIHLKVFDGKILLAELKISDVIVNSQIKESEFEIK